MFLGSLFELSFIVGYFGKSSRPLGAFIVKPLRSRLYEIVYHLALAGFKMGILEAL
jgi:hypothetical protein